MAYKKISFLLAAVAFTNLCKGQISLVSDIRTGAASSNIKFLTRLNNNVFFTADDGVAGEEPWISNKTAAEP